MNFVTLVIKPTHACNAACVYCSAWKEHDSNQRMSDATLERLHHWLAEAARNHGLKGVHFLWHGGEPLLVPNSFYEKAMELQASLLKPLGMDIENVVQSNLLAVNEEKADLLNRLVRKEDGTPCMISTSYDPIPGIRVMKQGSYEDNFARAVSLLSDRDLRVGLVYTTHRKALDRLEEVYRWFRDNLPEYDVRYNPMEAEGRARLDPAEDLHITWQQWGQAQVELYRLWEADGKPGEVEPFGELDRMHYEGEVRLTCNLAGHCWENFLGIDSDGSVYGCGRGIDRGQRIMGNLHQDDFATITQSIHLIHRRNRVLFLRQSACRNCAWWAYCHGGCPADLDLEDREFFDVSKWCRGHRYFLEEVYGSPREDMLPGPEALMPGHELACG